MNYALIGYPLSDDYRKQFEELIGGVPQYLSLQELRRMPIARALKTLVSLKPDRLFIAIEGQQAQALLPVFYCFAGVCRTRHIEVVGPDLSRKKISRWQTTRSLASIGYASWDCRRALSRCGKELKQLASLRRIPDTPPQSKSVFYLKSNLWLGVKAGGSVGHVAGVANSLLDRGYYVDYAGTEVPLMVKPQAGFCQLELPETFGIPYELNLFRFQEMMVRQLRKQLQTHRYGFIYQRMSVSNYVGVQLSREFNLPLILEYNGSEVWAQSNWGVAFKHQAALAAEEVSLKHAHLVVTVSEVLRDELVSRGVAPERVVNYPNCIDPEVFHPDRFTVEQQQGLKRKLGLDPDSRLAVFVGTFGPWHGVEVLAQAVRELALNSADWLKKHKLHFVIVGDGLRMPMVREILSDERCKPFCTLTGLVPQAEAPLYMGAAELLLSPHVPNADGTRFFGSPTKLFEYMAMGKPIIASDLEQIGQVLSHSLRVEDLPLEKPSQNESRISLLTPPGDVSRLVDGVRFLVDHPEWGTVLGKNVREETLRKYTWDRHVDAILDRLNSLTSTHGKNEGRFFTDEPRKAA
ncbi:MAG: glycosyltransferase [Planctomycetaceae bacterium]|nr:glycosyltransferase [Planctomycetaceae bacterium]